MKTLLTLLSLLLLHAHAQAACAKKVSASKIVVFVDTNNSPTEIKAATEAACERGETFVKLPKSGTFVSKKELADELNSMAAANKSLSSIVVSGHDGGGSIHGAEGLADNKLNKWDVIKAFNDAYKNKPELQKDFKSVFMWGCWSMGPSEVEIWRQQIPSLKMVSGFMDMGPKNTTAAAHTVLKGLLVKEKSLCLEADKKKLKRAIASVENINVTYAAVYTEAACGNEYWYRTDGDAYESKYSGSEHFTPGEHFLDFDKSFSCDSMKAQIAEYQQELLPYYYGDKELPADGPNSPIKKLYTFFRKAAHCIDKSHASNPDRMVLLRFYDAVKENFSKAFVNEIRDAHAEMTALDEFVKKNPSTAELTEFKRFYQLGRTNYFPINGKNLVPHSRKEIRNMISYFDGMLKQTAVTRNSAFAGKLVAIKRLRNAMEKYLYQMDPNCMDFLSWHEVEPNYTPVPLCSIR